MFCALLNIGLGNLRCIRFCSAYAHDGNKEYGISVVGGASGKNTGNKILASRADLNNVGIGYFSANGTVSGSTAMHNKYGFNIEGFRNIVQDNTAMYNAISGMQVTGVRNRLINNTLDANYDSGLQVGKSNAAAESNLFLDNRICRNIKQDILCLNTDKDSAFENAFGKRSGNSCEVFESSKVEC